MYCFDFILFPVIIYVLKATIFTLIPIAVSFKLNVAEHTLTQPKEKRNEHLKCILDAVQEGSTDG